MKPHPLVTTVVDVGARYGMHPSWSGFTGELRYVGFEPDADEAAKLRSRYSPESYEVLEDALGEETGTFPLYITKHRGFCSFRRPDLDNYYFRHVNPAGSTIEKTIQVRVRKLDEIALERSIEVDFMKIDTEGFDLEVLKGGASSIERNTLGLRVELHFQRCFEGQAIFPDIFNFLTQREFILLNLDYFGRGEPQHPLYHNSNPIVPDTQRYGMVIGTDGVFIRPYSWLVEKWNDGDALGRAVFKWAWFCMLNNAPDMALRGLTQFFASVDRGKLSAETLQSKLYRGLRKNCIAYLGQYRARPESHEWALAQELAAGWFDINLEGGSGYWDQIRELD